MADFPRTLACLDGASLGVLGVGHLGGALARGLLRAGFPAERLLLCHGGSAATAARLAEAGLSARVRDADELTRRSRIIMYCVRPQSFSAIGACELMEDALVLSFLAGIPLARLPLHPSRANRVRVMPSGPDTIEKGAAIAGIFPPRDAIAEELLGVLRIELHFLPDEELMHAFTAAGVCLPIVLACWRAQGNRVDEQEVTRSAERNGLPEVPRILAWALRAEPRFATSAEQEAYLRAAATPGGVTEAMIDAIRAGASLTETLDAGVRRSRELSEGPAGAS
jgi:pyrroline-5-carboxylate reductase